jgi:cephalosporin-C deacetylase-like acetyl esterase
MKPDEILQGRGGAMVGAYLVNRVKAAAARPLPKSKEEMEADKRRRRRELLRCLGLDPMPEKCALNPVVTGAIEGKGYWIEKIVFESRLNFPVTGHLYIPEAPSGTKFPVILNAVGHWEYKKCQPVVQARLISQALNGYMGFAIDSPGCSWDDERPIERKNLGTHWDFPLVIGSANTSALYVWDLIRALDYLGTRADVDTSKVGLTGESGGGIPSVYMFSVDERVKCSIPVVYATSLEVNPHNGCPCNHIPGVLQVGDRADAMAIRAPAPVLVIGAQEDWEFPPEGTKLTGEKLKAVWSLYGAEDAAEWQVFEGAHDYSKAMRERAIGFFNKHLLGKGDGSPVPDPEFDTRDPEDPVLICDPEPERLRFTMREVAFSNLLRALPRKFDDVVALNGGIPERAPLNFKVLAEADNRMEVTFDSEPGLTIPGLLWLPEGEPNGGVVLVSESGKTTAQTEFGVAGLLKRGLVCLAIDVRGFGELRGNEGERKEFQDVRCLDIRLTTYLGVADAFAMAVDAVAGVEALRQYAPRISVVGKGWTGSQVAMFAGLLDRDVEKVVGLQSMVSYTEALNKPAGEYWFTKHYLQPRANCGAPLSHLRMLLGERGLFGVHDEEEPDWVGFLD